jgi:hypothetical protein
MSLKLSIDTTKLEKRFLELGRQAPYAMMRTINKLAYDDVKPAFVAEMKAKLDRPTNFTLNSINIRPAKKDNLEAYVYIRDEAYKGTAPADYLLPVAAGSDAMLKRSEKLLRRRGVLKSNQRLIPGRRAKLNRYGNWSAAQMNKALSNIGHQSDRYQNTRRNTRKRKGQERYDYFLIPNGHPTLVPGIWKEEKGWAYPFVIFADQAADRKKLLNLQQAADVTIRLNFDRRANQISAKVLMDDFK